MTLNIVLNLNLKYTCPRKIKKKFVSNFNRNFGWPKKRNLFKAEIRRRHYRQEYLNHLNKSQITHFAPLNNE